MAKLIPPHLPMAHPQGQPLSETIADAQAMLRRASELLDQPCRAPRAGPIRRPDRAR